MCYCHTLAGVVDQLRKAVRSSDHRLPRPVLHRCSTSTHSLYTCRPALIQRVHTDYRVWNVLVFTIFIMSFSAWKCLTLRNRWKQDATLHWRPTRHILISTDISINYALLTTNPMISKRIHTKKTKNQDPNYPQNSPVKTGDRNVHMIVLRIDTRSHLLIINQRMQFR